MDYYSQNALQTSSIRNEANKVEVQKVVIVVPLPTSNSQ